MTREQILDFLSQHKQEMNIRFGVTKIGLFGSYARGEAREDSDVDVAIERGCKIVCVNGKIGKTQTKGETDGNHRRTARHFDEGLQVARRFDW